MSENTSYVNQAPYQPGYRTAWVVDNSWTPNMFSDSSISQLTDSGKLVNGWLAAKANSDWVQ